MGKLYEGPGYNSIVTDKLAVEIIKAKEGLDPFYSIRGPLVADCFNLFRIDLNSFCSNNKPKVLCMFYSKFAFLDIYLQACVL